MSVEVAMPHEPTTDIWAVMNKPVDALFIYTLSRHVLSAFLAYYYQSDKGIKTSAG